MRNGQNNKRMRGRNNNNNNNNNRKPQNPMSRVYESNGPDVKIRGTPSHIAEKYIQLARDAQASGDPVSAENYFQHAEHYLRLIAAAQEQYRLANPQFYRPENEGARDDAFDDGDEDDAGQQPGIWRRYVRDPRAAALPAARRAAVPAAGAAAASTTTFAAASPQHQLQPSHHHPQHHQTLI
jgi:hypothetical protein